MCRTTALALSGTFLNATEEFKIIAHAFPLSPVLSNYTLTHYTK